MERLKALQEVCVCACQVDPCSGPLDARSCVSVCYATTVSLIGITPSPRASPHVRAHTDLGFNMLTLVQV